MGTMQTLDVKDYIKKIDKMESMLQDIREGLFHLDKDFQDSIRRGERDIKEGRITVCRIEEDLDDFFRSL